MNTFNCDQYVGQGASLIALTFYLWVGVLLYLFCVEDTQRWEVRTDT